MCLEIIISTVDRMVSLIRKLPSPPLFYQAREVPVTSNAIVSRIRPWELISQRLVYSCLLAQL